jgi:branched-subunit amino acid transport protein
MNKPIIAVLLMALVTYIPRALPVSLFRKEIKSKYVKSFLQYVPYAVLGALTFPEIFYSTGNFITAVLGTLMALFLAYKEKSLVVVAIAAIVTVYISGLFF